MHVPWALRRRLRGLVPSALRQWARRPAVAPEGAATLVERYVAGGRVPWSTGYGEYRADFVARALDDTALMAAFREGRPLPDGYGPRLDERVVEYPWVLARAGAWGPVVLDAGSTLNVPSLLARPEVASRRLVVCNLVHDWTDPSGRVAYLTSDIRGLALREAGVDAVVCISTLEHVGLDNAEVYGAGDRYREKGAAGWTAAVAELRRVLRPGGRLLITAPFGRPTVLRWMQQFDAAGIDAIAHAFEGRLVAREAFRYEAAGWRRAAEAECAECEYYDVHARATFDADHAAAARAVVCLELERPR